MRLKRFDMNLLVVLDALLTEQSTTRAAERLALSQPAVSLALKRLRAYFNDELLGRAGRRLAPTPLGLSLARPVRELLLQSEAALQSQPYFDPARERRRFVLMMSDYVSVVLMAEVAKRAAATAPGLSFDLLPSIGRPWEAVDEGNVDLLVLPEEFLPPDYVSEELFSDSTVCVCWSGNKAVGARLSKSQFSTLGHVLAHPGLAGAERRELAGEALYPLFGQSRRIEIIVPDYGTIPNFVIGSQRIATMHARQAHHYARYLPLRVLPLPFASPMLTERMYWHRHRSADRGLAWLRELMRTTARELRSASGAARRRSPSGAVPPHTRARAVRPP